VFVLAAIACLLATEGIARALAPAMPEPEIWPDDATTLKVAQIDALGCADVVFVGNSVARDGLDPRTFTEADRFHRSAYNAALDAAAPLQQAEWLLGEVLPHLAPSVVVWSLTSPDLNDAAPAGGAALESYGSSIGGRDDLLGRLQRPLVDHVALARYRTTLGDPGALATAVADRLAGDRAPRISAEGLPGLIGDGGEGLSRRDLRYVPDDPVVGSFVRAQLLEDFAVGGTQQDAAASLIADLGAAGIEVVLVVPPVTDEFVALHPDGQVSWDRYRDAVTDIAEQTGVPVIDLADGAADPLFADTHHLNADGAAWMSQQVAAELDDLGITSGDCATSA
jgi:hypothetical protein